jgi:NADPH:quinone reductase-like Zn-dependent oxidoreductase
MPFHQLEIKELLEISHTPGIDAVGTIISSKTNKFKADDKVIVTSYDLGMNTDGGLGNLLASLKIGLLSYLSMKEAMTLGTAGLTAGMSILRLTETIKPEDGIIVVSGATGGGRFKRFHLKKLGYRVVQ